MRRRDIGILGENIARDFLLRKGYQIISKNYRCPYGEIDIIARDDDCLVFVEVKTRTSLEFGHPEESITATKQVRLRQVALHYLQAYYDSPPDWRIDVVGIRLDQKAKPERIELIKNAVQEE
ncbi:MAG: YraN family protein [Dehalococcoidales bacterium]|jgi:putative endonuclease